jgi:hypothetical protein
MTAAANPHAKVCPECGAMLAVSAGTCWLCHRPLTDDSSTDDAITTTVPPLPHTAPAIAVGRAGQFSLAALMLTVTFVAVLLGLFVQVRGLAIVLAVLAAPALIKTSLIGRRHKAAGEPLTPGGKALTLIAALCFLVAIAVATAGAFFLACLGTLAVGEEILGDLDTTIMVALVGASAVAIPILAIGAWFFWRWRRKV